MGELGNKRNNLLAENGLLFDAAGNIFDLTQWYKDNNIILSNQSAIVNAAILGTLQKIETHLSLMTGEELEDTDIKQDDEL